MLTPRGSLMFLLFATFWNQSALAAEKPERAVRAVLDAQVAAWNRGDLNAYMNGYWKSPELTFYSTGTVAKGWDSTLQRYRTRYQGEGTEMGKLAFTELHITVLSNDAALVRGGWQLKTQSETNPGGLFTLIVRKLPEGWRIVHDHTSNR